MNRCWFVILFHIIIAVVYGVFCWHLIRWESPSRPYEMKDEKEVVFHLKDKVKDEWNLEQCGHLKGAYIPCERPVIVPVPSTLLLILLAIIPLILKRKGK